MAGQQPQPCLWTLPPQQQRRVVHTFTGARNGKSREAAHVTSESTPLSVHAAVLRENYYFAGCGDESLLQFLKNSDDGHSPERDVTEVEMFVLLALTLQMGTYSSRQTGGLLDENGTASHSILWTNDGTC